MLGLKVTKWSPVEAEEHRRQLNGTGYQAYLIPVLGLLGIYALRTILSTRHTTYEKSQGTLSIKSSFAQRTICRLHWILTTTYSAEYGPVYLLLLASAYTISLAYLAIAPAMIDDRQADYPHVMKAFGHVAVSQLPFLYLLSVKSPSSPISVATRLTHERLNAVHRVFARIIYTFLCFHAALYLNFFVTMKALAKRVKDLDVIAGISAISLFTVLVTLAQPIVRQKWYYAGFYRVHVLVSASLLGIIWIHVPYTRIYVAQAAFIWVASAISRNGHGTAGWSENAIVRSKNLGSSNGDLVEVTATISGATGKQHWLRSWVPGMHGYINRGMIGPKVPFTVVNVETSHGVKGPVSVKMIVKNLGGPTTGLLGDMAKSEKSLQCRIEGPYGEAKEYIPRLLEAGSSAGKILVVAGGVGATYALPIYLALLKARKGNSSGLRFIWIVKHGSDAQWGVKLLQASTVPVDVEIIATQSETANDIDQESGWRDIAGLSFKQKKSRPDMGVQVDDFLGDHFQQASVMVCGPPGLTQTLRTEVGRHVLKYGTHIDWHEEQFGFGGS